MLTPMCELLLPRLQEIPELAVAPDSLLVPPCPCDVWSQCEASECMQPARFLRMFLEDSEVALALSVYQIEQPYVAYESDGFVYGIDHEGPHRTAVKTMYRQPISPEESCSPARLKAGRLVSGKASRCISRQPCGLCARDKAESSFHRTVSTNVRMRTRTGQEQLPGVFFGRREIDVFWFH
jgi:hypothetical protein